MSAVLEFDQISKDYRSAFGKRSVRALDGFSLALEQGEIFGFLGPNGAGKSTAIHLAMGFMRASNGTGRMLGQPFGYAPIRKRVGFLAENVALYHRPVKKLVRFYGGLNGLRGAELERRTQDVIDLLELGDVQDRNAAKLSRGMLQRVGLAQALVNDPDLLILDEPTSALDPLGRIAIRELLRKVKARGKTIFLSSHLLSEIELVCDRIGILVRGRLLRVGRTTELVETTDEFEIFGRGIPTDFAAKSTSDDGLMTFTIPRAQQQAVIERIWAAGGEVVRVNPKRKSLEDLFVELTSEHQQ